MLYVQEWNIGFQGTYQEVKCHVVDAGPQPICHFHASLSDCRYTRNPSLKWQKYESLYVICSRWILMEHESQHKAWLQSPAH